jgi:hypothetical protein
VFAALTGVISPSPWPSPLAGEGQGEGQKNILRKAQLNTQNHSGQYAILASIAAWLIMLGNQVRMCVYVEITASMLGAVSI